MERRELEHAVEAPVRVVWREDVVQRLFSEDAVRERFFIGLVTSDRKLKASREGSK